MEICKVNPVLQCGKKLFIFDNIHNLNFIETQVVVLVVDLAPKVVVLEHWVLVLVRAPEFLILVLRKMVIVYISASK